MKSEIAAARIDGLSFRKINDAGECATLLSVQFRTTAQALAAAHALGTRTLEKSGWHVYNNMEQVLAWKDAAGRSPLRRNMLPATDDILSRSINLSVGVVDGGIGADFGITILSSADDIHRAAEKLVNVVKDAVRTS